MVWSWKDNPIYNAGQNLATWTGAGTNNEWDIADESESQLKGLRMRDVHNIPAARNFYQRNFGTQAFPHSRYNYRSVDPSNPDFSGITTIDQPQKKGFWSNFTTPVMGIMRAFADKMKRSPEKQAEIDAFNQTGMFGNLQGKMWDDPRTSLSKVSLRDPITGAIVLRNKNVDSLFGSKTIEEMAAKKNAWIKERIAKNKPISTALQAYAKNQGYYDPPGNITTGGDNTFRDTSGWSSPGYSTRGGFTGKADPTSGGVRGHHGGWADGGRIGYRFGEAVEQETDFIEGPQGDEEFSETLMASDPGMGEGPFMLAEYLEAVKNGYKGSYDDFINDIDSSPSDFMAAGGRAGYQGGELVEQQTDLIEGPQGGEEFQETVVEGQEQPSREQLEALSMEIFQLPLDELDDQQLLVVYQEAMQGQPMEEAVQEEDVQFAANGGLAGLL